MTQPTWEQAITDGPCGNLPEPYQRRWDSIASGIAHVFFASDEDYDNAFGRELTDDDFDRISEFDWQRQKKVTAMAFFELLRLVAKEREACAKVCDKLPVFGLDIGLQKATLKDAAEEIRARKDNT